MMKRLRLEDVFHNRAHQRISSRLGGFRRSCGLEPKPFLYFPSKGKTTDATQQMYLEASENLKMAL